MAPSGLYARLCHAFLVFIIKIQNSIFIYLFSVADWFSVVKFRITEYCDLNGLCFLDRRQRMNAFHNAGGKEKINRKVRKYYVMFRLQVQCNLKMKVISNCSVRNHM